MADEPTVILQQIQPGIALIRLSRPATRNALTREMTFSEAVALENRTQILATQTEDYREATAAFLARRPPSYSGR